MIGTVLTTIQRLELDIDIRIRHIWEDLNKIEEWDIETIGAYVRAAYGAGYCDALKEKERGQLCKDYGYPVPGS